MPRPDFDTVKETIRDHNEIVDVIGSYVQLKKAGRSFKACCPFHKEKTPSFHVNPARQSFHCFGCGVGGDVFTFVMQYEKVDFMEAARMLADRANLPFEYDAGASQEKTSRKNELLSLHAQLATWYNLCLKKSSQAEKARAYLAEREISDDAVESFCIGYAPARDVDWTQWAAKRKFGMDLMEEAGIVVRRDRGGWYDRFADRLMFPIHDESGRVIGFSGRLLPGDERPAKYVNSPETPLFTKSKVFYALHEAKRAILDANEALLCEGQIDVIRCHIAGIKNAVAAQGTAVTEIHAKTLKRLADTVRLVLDSDEAGKNAAMRSADILIATGLRVLVTNLPEGDDPDTIIRREGADAFVKLLDASQSALDFQVDTLMSREQNADDAAVLRVARAVLESISQAPSAIQRDQLIQQASVRLGLRPDTLQSEIQSMAKKQTRRDTSETYEDITPDHPPEEHAAEELELLRLAIHLPETLAFIRQYVEPRHFRSAACRALYQYMLAHEGSAEIDFMAALPAQAVEERRVVAMLSAENRFTGTEFNMDRAAQELVMAMRRRDFESRRRALENRRRTAQGQEAEALESEISELTLHQHTLRSGWDKAKWMLEIDRALPDGSP